MDLQIQSPTTFYVAQNYMAAEKSKDKFKYYNKKSTFDLFLKYKKNIDIRKYPEHNTKIYSAQAFNTRQLKYGHNRNSRVLSKLQLNVRFMKHSMLSLFRPKHIKSLTLSISGSEKTTLSQFASWNIECFTQLETISINLAKIKVGIDYVSNLIKYLKGAFNKCHTIKLRCNIVQFSNNILFNKLFGPSRVIKNIHDKSNNSPLKHLDLNFKMMGISFIDQIFENIDLEHLSDAKVTLGVNNIPFLQTQNQNKFNKFSNLTELSLNFTKLNNFRELREVISLIQNAQRLKSLTCYLSQNDSNEIPFDLIALIRDLKVMKNLEEFKIFVHYSHQNQKFQSKIRHIGHEIAQLDNLKVFQFYSSQIFNISSLEYFVNMNSALLQRSIQSCYSGDLGGSKIGNILQLSRSDFRNSSFSQYFAENSDYNSIKINSQGIECYLLYLFKDQIIEKIDKNKTIFLEYTFNQDFDDNSCRLQSQFLYFLKKFLTELSEIEEEIKIELIMKNFKTYSTLEHHVERMKEFMGSFSTIKNLIIKFETVFFYRLDFLNYLESLEDFKLIFEKQTYQKFDLGFVQYFYNLRSLTITNMIIYFNQQSAIEFLNDLYVLPRLKYLEISSDNSLVLGILFQSDFYLSRTISEFKLKVWDIFYDQHQELDSFEQKVSQMKNLTSYTIEAEQILEKDRKDKIYLLGLLDVFKKLKDQVRICKKKHQINLNFDIQNVNEARKKSQGGVEPINTKDSAIKEEQKPISNLSYSSGLFSQSTTSLFTPIKLQSLPSDGLFGKQNNFFTEKSAKPFKGLLSDSNATSSNNPPYLITQNNTRIENMTTLFGLSSFNKSSKPGPANYLFENELLANFEEQNNQSDDDSDSERR